jgi:FG-GAP-like repeat
MALALLHVAFDCDCGERLHTQLPGGSDLSDGHCTGCSCRGDFDADGKLDLAVMNAGNAGASDDGSVSILLGNGDGTFKAAMNFSTCKNCTRIAAADFNADNKSDLAVLRPGDATATDDGDVTVFLSNGDSTFRKGQVLTPGKNPSSVIAPDLNADHRFDLVVTNQTDNTVAILFGNGDGTFQAPVPYATAGGQPASTLLVDFNQDSLEDLAVRCYFGHTDIFLANGDGTFRSGASFNTGLLSIVA